MRKISSTAKRAPTIQRLSNNFKSSCGIKPGVKKRKNIKPFVPVERYYEIDDWYNFVSKHPYIFHSKDYYVFMSQIALNIAEYGLPSTEFENGILFVLQYIQSHFLDKISCSFNTNTPSSSQFASLPPPKILNNVFLCVKVLAAPVLEFCLELHETKLLSKKYNINKLEEKYHPNPTIICKYSTFHKIKYWKTFLFHLFSSYDAFKLICDKYISKASFETIKLVEMIHLIVYDAPIHEDCCKLCLERTTKLVSEAILLAVINSPIRTFSFDSDLVVVDHEQQRTKRFFDVFKLKDISSSILMQTNDTNTIRLCINSLLEKRYSIKNELYLAQYVICRNNKLSEVFSKALNLPSEICHYILSNFVGYNFNSIGSIRRRRRSIKK
jgi:hypothetical protein